MKCIVLLIALTIGMGALTAQVKALKMTNSISAKEVVIKENMRVIVKTKTGEKVKGRLSFVNDELIALNGQEIFLADIVKIQRNPLLLSILVDGLMLYTAAGVLLVGLVITAFSGGGPEILYFVVPAAALVYGGIASPKFTKGYKTYKNWSYEVIMIPDPQ